MEFFEWMYVPQTILRFFSFEVEDDIVSFTDFQIRLQIIILCVAAGIYLIEHLLGGYGLYKIAKRAGDKLAWMAYIPFLNTYLMGRIAGETNFLGIKIKRIGLYAAISEAVYVLLGAFTLVLSLVLMNPAWNVLQIQTINGIQVITGVEPVLEAMPVGLRWLPNASFAVEIVFNVWSFVLVVLFCIMSFAFFRKYYARSPFIMAFLCSLFPFRGFVLFAVRNNAPVDYNEWMMERFREYQRQQQQQYGRPYDTTPPPGPGPFDEFGGDDNKGHGDDEPFNDL